VRIITGSHCDPDASHHGLLATLNQQAAFGVATLDNVGALIAEFGIDATRLATEDFARRCRVFLRDSDALIEFSDSRAYFVLPDLNDVNHLLLAALKLERLFDWPFENESYSLPLDVHVGWVHCSASDFSTEENKALILGQAEQARQQAITSGASYEIQSTDQQSCIAVEPSLNEAALANIDSHDISLDYQAKYCLSDGVLAGTQAQVCWRREGILIPQTEFMPLLSADALWQVTRHCLRTTIRDSLKFTAETRIALQIESACINANLVNLIKEELALWNVPATRLMIELSDWVPAIDADEVLSSLNELRQAGVKTSMANFGGAHTSIQNICVLPFDEIVLDRTLIHDLTENDANQKLSQSLIDLCHRFSTPVLADGIENGETVAWLINAGCDLGKGFYLGAPMNKDRFALLIH
jgi:EAL domain-containing protein (putative c-di-GMP-specific phosphodiesterase class I)/GGDEF domain-containing protein